MDVRDAPRGDGDSAEEYHVGHDAPVLTSHESRPGRTIITEEGNPDAWIATDLVVDDWR
jgi:hypothetical protein